jgi:electron transport complex protein RnfA
MTAFPFGLLAVFSSLSLNLVLQCGLGMRGIARFSLNPRRHLLARPLILCLTVLVLWMVFAKLLAPLSPGIFIYLLMFPVSSLVSFALEYLAGRFLFKTPNDDETPLNACDGMAAAALFICFNIAGNFIEALALSFGSAFGTALAFLVISEIRRRALLEAVPRFLRGSPLVLVSMGLLSMIFSSAAIMLFALIGV